ncbi:MAG: signal recognition particle-docking protein FtsY [Alphaproteobacteria bacterium]|nr:signal recognition particle-docking protein FtsY [Alphaproteobacteria bacterium]
MSWFSKLKQGLSKTASLFSFNRVDAADLEIMEEALIRSDVGYQTATEIMECVRRQKPADGESLYKILSEQLIRKMEPVAKPLLVDRNKKPFIILMIGVNGAGKTTTIGKLGHFYQQQGLKVAFVAADTFRAGATEQLCRWGERLSCPVYTGNPGADAAGLVFDAVRKSQQAGDDVLFVDTAGRLQNRSDLMDELKKINRVIRKLDASAPQATVLVLDATVGQNALSQVQTFRDDIGVTGLVMTKLDGTAKGGILVALADRFELPIYAIGVGEQMDDLNAFTATEYVQSLIGEPK